MARGRLVTHLAGPAEAGGVAALLQGTEGVAGLAWASVDHTCRLDYSVRMEVGARMDSPAYYSGQTKHLI